jgi:hypothetical protein
MESFLVFLSQLPGPPISVDRIPTAFHDLDELERHIISVRRGQLALSTAMTDIIKQSGILASKDESFITDCLTKLFVDPRLKEFCGQTKELVQAIENPLSSLFKKIIMSEPQSPEYLRAIHLRLQYLLIIIFTDPAVFIDVDAIQKLTPKFREVLSLVDITLRATQDSTKSYFRCSLQSEISWILLLTSFFCRDPLIRDEAILMLKNYPGQDGLRNNRALYALAKKNRSVERENEMHGTPAEQLYRLIRREFIFEDYGDRIVIRYMNRDESTGVYHVVEEAADIVGGFNTEVQWKRQPLTGDGGLLMKDVVDFS